MGQRPRCPQPHPETAQNAKINPSAKTAQYRNQIFTLLGASPLSFTHYQARWNDADVEIYRDDSGKPHPIGKWNDFLTAKLDLAIAHTAQFVVAAVAANARVGIDVEARDRDLSEEFTNGVFTPEEQELAARATDAPSAILRFWCAKEAVSKALGTGIRYSPKELVVESFRAENGEMTVRLTGQWLENFKMFTGRTIRVSSCIVRDHALASCFIPASLFN